MKIIMTLLVRDEEDILKENIDYHLNQGVDFILATDNCSVDSTKDILKNYEKKGLLEYIFESDDNYNQHAWVTEMARAAACKYNADWVINNDADEFWWPSNHPCLKTALSSVEKSTTIVEAARNNFVYIEPYNQSTPFYKRMKYRERQSLNPLGNPLPPKQAHIAHSNIIVNQGNHSVSGIDKVIQKDLIEILHYPIRSKTQLTNKIQKGGAAYERNQTLEKHIGQTWKTLYQQLNSEGSLNTYLTSNTFSPELIEEHLQQNNIIEDGRLGTYLSNYYERNSVKLGN